MGWYIDRRQLQAPPARSWRRSVVSAGSLAKGLALALLLIVVSFVSPARVHAESMTLNLKDADINAVIATVAEMTGKNFIVDPRVKGKVTVISSRPMNADEIYQVFLSVLSVNGYAAIPSGKVIKIVPQVNAKQDAVRTSTDANPGRGDEYVTRVIRVTNVAATQLVTVVRPLLPQEAHLAAYPDTNVLVVSAPAETVNRLVEIIRRIDTYNNSGVEAVRLNYASADEVAHILTSLLADTTKGGPPAKESKVLADSRTNTVLLSGDQATRARLKAIIDNLDMPLEQSGNSRVIYLRYANAKDLVQVLTGISNSLTSEAKKGGIAAAAQDKPVIEADEATNALVIHAAPDVIRDLESVIRQIDIKRAQVLVNAIIAEVSSDKANELGVQWIYDGSSTDAPVGVINFAGSGSGLTNLLATPPVISDGLSLAVGDTSGNGFRLGALLRALSGDGETNVLSTPSLVTLDNQEAQIVVGQNVPFITGSYASTSSGSGSTVSNPFQTIQRQDVGLKLKIKPQINEGSSIKLEIEQEVSSLASGTTGASDLITNKRALKTSVMVDDGQMIVLGGLVDDNLIESVQKVPLLGDIPVLGTLFSYKKTHKVKRNLMVFINPVILRDKEQSMAHTADRYKMMRDKQLNVRKRGVNLMPDSVSPLLPEMATWMALPPPYQGGDAAPSPLTDIEPPAAAAPSQQPAQPPTDTNGTAQPAAQ